MKADVVDEFHFDIRRFEYLTHNKSEHGVNLENATTLTPLFQTKLHCIQGVSSNKDSVFFGLDINLYTASSAILLGLNFGSGNRHCVLISRSISYILSLSCV